jgi:hypothetical protein
VRFALTSFRVLGPTDGHRLLADALIVSEQVSRHLATAVCIAVCMDA